MEEKGDSYFDILIGESRTEPYVYNIYGQNDELRMRPQISRGAVRADATVPFFLHYPVLQVTVICLRGL